VGLGDVVDELLNQDGLTDTGTTKESNLSTTSVGGEKVDDLDTGLENLSLGRLVDELGSVGVDRTGADSLDGAALVDRLTNDVDDTTERSGTDGDLDGGAVSMTA
jgi:hypothetical protein